MADLALGSVEKVFKAGVAIKEAVATARRNKKECRDIERCVSRVGALLSLLDETTELMKHPAMSGPLEDLAESLEEALELITDCQERSVVRRFLLAGDVAKQLRRVQDDILRKLTLGNFATNVQITITLTNTIRYGGAHPQPQDAGEVEISYSSHLTTDDARSEVNSEITMVATGSEVPYAPSARLTEFRSELEVTTHHSSEENITGGDGRPFVYKQKIVIRLQMACGKCRSKVLALVAATGWVVSVALAGDARDQVVVIGDGLDSIKLTSALRKKVGPAQLMQVGEDKEDDKNPAAAVTVPEYQWYYKYLPSQLLRPLSALKYTIFGLLLFVFLMEMLLLF
ncbi:uncharacterized protein LOC133899973 [Phragmites australis]|uniref:uncharacterized protein LOC133899973 n=1 Tax=Phragmites australis TaxID=29695 RepID=UPI002D7A2018|nr:uncharacterized protein LOC133899973 [Phragmites australis]